MQNSHVFYDACPTSSAQDATVYIAMVYIVPSVTLCVYIVECNGPLRESANDVCTLLSLELGIEGLQIKVKVCVQVQCGCLMVI